MQKEIFIKKSNTIIVTESNQPEHIRRPVLIMSTIVVPEENKIKSRTGKWNYYDDIYFWQDKLTGYYCVIKLKENMTLCGYVLIGEENKFYGASWREKDSCKEKIKFLRELECHGGVTFIGKLSEVFIVEREYKDKFYVVGFDCSHIIDFVPLPFSYTESLCCSEHLQEYRDLEYVKENCILLANQIYHATSRDPHNCGFR